MIKQFRHCYKALSCRSQFVGNSNVGDVLIWPELCTKNNAHILTHFEDTAETSFVKGVPNDLNELFWSSSLKAGDFLKDTFIKLGETPIHIHICSNMLHSSERGIESIGELISNRFHKQILRSTNRIIITFETGIDYANKKCIVINQTAWIRSDSSKHLCFNIACAYLLRGGTFVCSKSVGPLDACVNEDVACLIYFQS